MSQLENLENFVDRHPILGIIGVATVLDAAKRVFTGKGLFSVFPASYTETIASGEAAACAIGVGETLNAQAPTTNTVTLADNNNPNVLQLGNVSGAVIAAKGIAPGAATLTFTFADNSTATLTVMVG